VNRSCGSPPVRVSASVSRVAPLTLGRYDGQASRGSPVASAIAHCGSAPMAANHARTSSSAGATVAIVNTPAFIGNQHSGQSGSLPLRECRNHAEALARVEVGALPFPGEVTSGRTATVLTCGPYRATIQDGGSAAAWEGERSAERPREIPPSRDQAPRSITASMSRRPTPRPCTAGSTVIGPTPRTGPRSSRKFEPTMRPSISATTP
jgi:hypothetical protein